MKKFLSILFITTLIACDANPSRDVLEEKLKSAMINFLYKGVDSSKVKFRIEDVIYYDDQKKNMYDCQFKVLMSQPDQKDTTGIMFAFISKDFKDVKRTY